MCSGRKKDEYQHGMDDEDEEAVAVDRKRVRHSKQEKDESCAKLKKKARVLVEVEHEDTDDRQVAIQRHLVVEFFHISLICIPYSLACFVYSDCPLFKVVSTMF